MSDPNQDNSNSTDAEKPKASFDDFEVYFQNNPGADNTDFYNEFPSNPKSTLRKWKQKLIVSDPDPEPSDDPDTDQDKKSKAYLKEAVKALKTLADKNTLALIKDLDPENQLIVLKKNAEIRKPDPNSSSLPTPTGSAKVGLEKYMTINQATGSIQWEIPATILLDPEKNKQLGET